MIQRYIKKQWLAVLMLPWAVLTSSSPLPSYLYPDFPFLFWFTSVLFFSSLFLLCFIYIFFYFEKISSLSGDHFIRSMKETSTYLSTLGVSKNDLFEAFPFTGYNVVGGDTLTNQIPVSKYSIKGEDDSLL